MNGPLKRIHRHEKYHPMFFKRMSLIFFETNQLKQMMELFVDFQRFDSHSKLIKMDGGPGRGST
jgi:hypothetical protein